MERIGIGTIFNPVNLGILPVLPIPVKTIGKVLYVQIQQ